MRDGTVNGDHCTVQVAGGRREDDRHRDIIRRTRLPTRDSRERLSEEGLAKLLGGSMQALRGDRARLDDVNPLPSALVLPLALSLHLNSQFLNQASHTQLLRRVDSAHRQRHPRGSRTGHHDRSSRIEVFPALLNCIGRATEIELDGVIDLFGRHIAEIFLLTSAGIDNRDVNGSHVSQEVTNVSRDSNIADDPALLRQTELREGFLNPRRRSRGDEDRRPQLPRQFCSGETDPSGPSEHCNPSPHQQIILEHTYLPQMNLSYQQRWGNPRLVVTCSVLTPSPKTLYENFQRSIRRKINSPYDKERKKL